MGDLTKASPYTDTELAILDIMKHTVDAKAEKLIKYVRQYHKIYIESTRQLRDIINNSLKQKMIDNKEPFTIVSGNYGYRLAYYDNQQDRAEIEHHVAKELASARSREHKALELAAAAGVDVRG
ncbi:hypothetical protein [Culicoidibacter larvae]|uniref:Uncharacterized protein n=1 Tax=Culicoidibacter larvae TaxID=2579976 RepID=A0A5R8Q8Q0_9FIRM|nr:hypothetical protein [Culicoidibacter larvae]TLG72081.1 hypothetical protein FEZ08_09620 [Culicoidibacter larvae]